MKYIDEWTEEMFKKNKKTNRQTLNTKENYLGKRFNENNLQNKFSEYHLGAERPNIEIRNFKENPCTAF